MLPRIRFDESSQDDAAAMFANARVVSPGGTPQLDDTFGSPDDLDLFDPPVSSHELHIMDITSRGRQNPPGPTRYR